MTKLFKINRKNISNIIGEVVLILVGVFLGLQVDRWNEQRKNIDRELLILNDIKNDLNSSENELNEYINFNNFSLSQLKKIKSILENPSSYESDLINSLSLITEWKSPYMTSVAYQTFKGEELGLINNDDVKKKIIQLNEVNLLSISKDYDNIETDFSQNIVWPILMRKMEPIPNSKGNNFRPNNFNDLKNDTEFKMMINSLIQLRAKGIELMSNCKNEISYTIKLIENETSSE